jgi:hypothetical protein
VNRRAADEVHEAGFRYAPMLALRNVVPSPLPPRAARCVAAGREAGRSFRDATSRETANVPVRHKSAQASPLPRAGADGKMNGQTCAVTLDQSYALHALSKDAVGSSVGTDLLPRAQI